MRIVTILLLAVLAAGSASCTNDLDAAFASTARVANVTSVSVHQDGALVREEYYLQTDADTPHDVRSVTKTVTSLLIGIAIDTGCLTSLDQTLGALLGDQAPGDPAKAAITLRDLLKMSSGFDWLERGTVGYTEWVHSDDQVQYVLSRPLVAPPGTVFNYNSGALHLLSVILTRACAPTAEFAAQHLFGPLGIASRPWETDRQGVTNGAAGLQLSTTEMAAVGELLLEHGRLHDAQIAPATYVDMAIDKQIATERNVGGYGYGIWAAHDGGGAPYALAEGYGGQFIVVVPRARAVIVITANWQLFRADASAQATRTADELLEIIVNQFVPAL
jgi:CubicO group peptidase (beta-lactamase class C family)